MKISTKNVCKKLLTVSLVFLSCCVVKAANHEIEPKRSLAVISNQIITLEEEV